MVFIHTLIVGRLLLSFCFLVNPLGFVESCLFFLGRSGVEFILWDRRLRKFLGISLSVASFLLGGFLTSKSPLGVVVLGNSLKSH